MTTATGLKIVEAREEHIPFIAWVELAAARSHLPIGMWDLYLEQPEADTLRYIETMVNTEVRHFGHYTNFIVAEVDGRPAAALSGYFEAEKTMPMFIAGQEEANRKHGISSQENDAGWGRAGSILNINISHAPDAWIIEWVATAPEFRRRGLVDALMAEILNVGRKRGASTADIGVFIDNDRAQRAYEKAGFIVIAEVRNADFEAAYNCPGARLLRRAI